MDIASLSWSDLLVGFLLTWTVGLTPPLVIRYVMVRRPLAKWAAIVTVIAFWLVEFLFALTNDVMTSPMQRTENHPALILIAVVSYFILTRSTKRATSMTPLNEDVLRREPLRR